MHASDDVEVVVTCPAMILYPCHAGGFVYQEDHIVVLAWVISALLLTLHGHPISMNIKCSGSITATLLHCCAGSVAERFGGGVDDPDAGKPAAACV